MTKKPKIHNANTPPEDEQSLWQRVAETLSPLSAPPIKRGRVRVSGGTGPVGEDEAAIEANASSAINQPKPAQPKRPAQKPRPQPLIQKQPPSAPPPSQLAQSELKKLRSGRIEIDGRLDLHGMRQGEAHAALRRFLYAAQSRGWRWVIVITGKGVQSELRRGEQSHGGYDGFDGSGAQSRPGILRRTVPMWLQEPDLRAVVIGFQTAGRQHGGEGALYVRLRRADRAQNFRRS